MLQSKIKQIHDSELYGSIFEFGCGACITNELLSVEGGTKTLFESSIPYSKEVQERRYGKGNTERSVSKEFVYKVLFKEFYADLAFNSRTNFALAASFQLHGSHDNVLTHGYIGLATHDTTRIYHVTIPIGYEERKDTLRLIAETAIEILGTAPEDINSPYIDMVYKVKEIFETCKEVEFQPLHSEVFDILKELPSDEDNFIVIKPNLDFIRFEDLVRDKPGVILLKGSFNPIHERHIELMEDSKQLYPDYASAFFISIRRFDKPHLTNEELKEKILKITSLGYTVVINTNQYFNGCVSWIRQRWNMPVLFPAGIDTLNRWVDFTKDQVIDFVSKSSELRAKYFPREGWTDKPKPITEEQLAQTLQIFSDHNIIPEFKFLVFDRKDYKLSENVKYFQEFYEIVEPEGADALGISSTKIRNGEIKSTI